MVNLRCALLQIVVGVVVAGTFNITMPTPTPVPTPATQALSLPESANTPDASDDE